MCGVMEALAVGAGVLSYSAQQQQTDAAVAAYNAQADNADQNARIQSQKGSQIADQYAQQQAKLDDRRKLARGQIAAEQGAAGVTGGSGLDILSSSNYAYKQDSANLLQDQRYDTWSNYTQQVNFENQASGYRSSARNAQTQGNMAQFGTILGTAASLYGMRSGSKSGSTGTGNSYSGAYTPYNATTVGLAAQNNGLTMAAGKLPIPVRPRYLQGRW